MADVVLMPKLSDTMEEGVIARWVKKEGDMVKEGELLAEIETDKATMEYESPQKGVLLKIITPAGKKTAIQQPICVFGQKDEKFDMASLGGSAKEAAKAPSKAAAAPEKTPVKSDVSQVSHVSNPAQNQASGRVRSSPLARKMAQEKGINLAQLQGSGPGGRVVVKDLESARSGSGQNAGFDIRTTTSRTDQLVPVSMMRQTIAKRLHTAKNDAPHFYLTVSADMSEANRWREKVNASQGKDPAKIIKVSVNDIVMMACAKALRKHPQVNASWEGETIRLFGGVHVAMAVALPTGLITPVIRNCDDLGILSIAQQSRTLATRAKGGELKPEDYTGGTFTVSNLGMFGIEEFTAIINPPQAAILAVGATIPTPWVTKSGEVVAQPRMKMTMSCDHRVVDGALGAQFLQTLVSFLEDPLMMLA